MSAALEAAVGRAVSRETLALLERYAALLRSAASGQNLIARSTLDTLRERHIVDSAQLVRWEPRPGAAWVDIGSGAGLPGLVIAALVDGPVTLVEPRRLRADFLERSVAELGLAGRVTVVRAKAERVDGRFDVITGRAVASLPDFLDLSHHLSTKNTVWVLPKGRGAQSELEEVRRSWHCDAWVQTSCTDPESSILVLRGVGKNRR
jgi:16S rRNA (guanine527-N7)-methyltransferase